MVGVCEESPLHPILDGVAFQSCNGRHLAQHHASREEHSAELGFHQGTVSFGGGEDCAGNIPAHFDHTFLLCGDMMISYGHVIVNRDFVTFWKCFLWL